MSLADVGVSELLEPVPSKPRSPPRPDSFFKYTANGEGETLLKEEALSNSKLNYRKSREIPELSQGSVLNVRYVKPTDSAVPVTESESGTLPPSSSVLSPQSPSTNSDIPVAASKLNQRYLQGNKDPNTRPTSIGVYDDIGAPTANGKVTNGAVPNGNIARHGLYEKHDPSQSSGAKNVGHSAKNEILRQKRPSRSPRHSATTPDISDGSGLMSDVDNWIDNIFDMNINSPGDVMSEPQSLEHRLKGGGEQAAQVGTIGKNTVELWNYGKISPMVKAPIVLILRWS